MSQSKAAQLFRRMKEHSTARPPHEVLGQPAIKPQHAGILDDVGQEPFNAITETLTNHLKATTLLKKHDELRKSSAPTGQLLAAVASRLRACALEARETRGADPLKHIVRNVETLRPGRVTPELRHRVLELVKIQSQGATARQLGLAQSTVAKIVKAATESKTC